MDVNSRANIISTLDPKHLELILYPTEQCNFRCSYCYEDFELGKMSDRVRTGVKNLISMRVSSLSRFHTSWFGGEPLAAKDVIHEISSFALDICGNHGVEYTGSLTTNGYLLNVDLARSLAQLHQTRYQISLDGYGSGHDATRKLAGGGATFKKIWGNLLNLRESDVDFKILIRVHLTDLNIDSVRELARHLREELLVDDRFSVLLKPVGNYGGPGAGAVPLLSFIRAESAKREINDTLRGFVDPIDVDSKPNVASGVRSPYVCYASRPNSLTIRADGRIQKCTVMLNDSQNNVGALDESGRVNLDREKMQFWMRGYSEGNEKILGCPATATAKNKKIPIVVEQVSGEPNSLQATI